MTGDTRKAVDKPAKAPRTGSPAAPTRAQRAYLERGLTQPGGKLPLFDAAGREVPRETIRVCLSRGWAEPWFANPIKPDWIVAKLTAAGYRELGVEPPARFSEAVD